MRQSDIRIQFRLLVGEDKVLIDEVLKNPESLLNYYLSEEDVTDSTFQGGYCIYVDGNKWNATDEFYFDMYAYSLNWLKGLKQLLSKEATKADVGFWEESAATATLIGDQILEIFDRNASGRVFAPSVQVDLKKFCSEMIEATKTYVSLSSQIKKLVEMKGNKIDQKKGEQVVREMCGEEYEALVQFIENLLK